MRMDMGAAFANQRVALLSLVGWLPFGVLHPPMASGGWAAVMVAPAVFFGALPFGLAPAAIQQLMPTIMRGQASAFYLFVVNLIGLGLGPTVVARLTEDAFHDKTIHPPFAARDRRGGAVPRRRAALARVEVFSTQSRLP